MNEEQATDREKLNQLSAWMGFVGIITIIGGILTALAGLFVFVVGAIPGIVTVVLGVKLRNAKKYVDAIIAEEDLESKSGNFNMFVSSLNTYFKIQGILIIISLVMAVVAVILGVFAGMFYMYTGTVHI